MKNIKFIIAAACVALFTACQDKGEWDVPSNPGSSYGNSSITEASANGKIISISELLTKFSNRVNIEGEYSQSLPINEDIYIKGVVTCNDRTGNLYREFTIQDETAAIAIGVYYGGMFGIVPEGQEILISLNGLYIGNYRLAATIGTPYTDNKNTICVGRMPLPMFNNHFNYTGVKKTIQPELFADGSTPTTWDITKHAGKLGTLKNVSIKIGGYYDNETEAYIANVPFEPGVSKFVVGENSTSWYFNEQKDDGNGAVQIYTSSYADFASKLAPTGKMNITGILKRYRQQWEIIVRDYNDIEVID